MITVENLCKLYKIKTMSKKFFPKYESKIGVESLSFHIEPGEMVGYIGMNGAGKSTTIKLLTGILRPTSGEVIVNGLVPYFNRKILASQIGVVFGQRNQLWWDLPLIKTFELLQAIYKIPKERYSSNLTYLKDLLELDEFLNTPVRQLSLGQRMRGNLVASLLHDPKILFLDEPTLGLDVLSRHELIQLIKRINRDRNVTVFLTTHNTRDIEELCNRIIIIDQGRKIYDRKMTSIQKNIGDSDDSNYEYDLEDFLLKLGKGEGLHLPQEQK